MKSPTYGEEIDSGSERTNAVLRLKHSNAVLSQTKLKKRPTLRRSQTVIEENENSEATKEMEKEVQEHHNKIIGAWASMIIVVYTCVQIYELFKTEGKTPVAWIIIQWLLTILILGALICAVLQPTFFKYTTILAQLRLYVDLFYVQDVTSTGTPSQDLAMTVLILMATLLNQNLMLYVFAKNKTYFNILNIITSIGILCRLYNLSNTAPGSAITILLNGLTFLAIQTINLYLTAALVSSGGKPMVREQTKTIREQYIETQDGSQLKFYADMLNELDQYVVVVENGQQIVFKNDAFRNLTKKIKTPLLELKMFKYQTFHKT